MRLCLLFALIGAAAVFDMYHASVQPVLRTKNFPASDERESNKIFFCNQVPVYNLKTPATDFVIRLRFAVTQDKFMLKHYNLRTFQMMKAETVHSFSLSSLSFHSLPFRRLFYSSPDDTPPLF